MSRVVDGKRPAVIRSVPDEKTFSVTDAVEGRAEMHDGEVTIEVETQAIFARLKIYYRESEPGDETVGRFFALRRQAD